MQHYTRQRLDEGAKQASVNRELSTLSHLMSWAVEWKWIKDSERPNVVKDEELRKRIVILRSEHAEALYRGAVADQDADLWLFVAIGLNTAMRHSEIARILWQGIVTDRRRIHVPKAKAGQREQPITASLANILAEERKRRKDDK
ncbi:hypothetical protein GRI89_12190 [Altererythrobacter salegens]|uniref:Tyr recombinase domain-containing protein n=1 Tax=Croceibacterium salegens TaxID=1737568 RepID=A0A6I4SXZ0_9SPHN|nr:hypothetical protein [Croceibacterium salegens]MXO60298.1 hypothetical protein [Croceibacterium salegens]